MHYIVCMLFQDIKHFPRFAVQREILALGIRATQRACRWLTVNEGCYVIEVLKGVIQGRQRVSQLVVASTSSSTLHQLVENRLFCEHGYNCTSKLHRQTSRPSCDANSNITFEKARDGLISSKFYSFENRISETQKDISESQLVKIQQNMLTNDSYIFKHSSNPTTQFLLLLI